MNRNKKTTKFFARNRRAGGFTLIELVVTIAILGILAGVAIPVYNGYIKKANQAADDQLLAAVNSAAAAAVLEARGVDMASLADRALTATVDASATPSITVSDAAAANVATAFAKYFAGNESAAFKYYSGLEFKNGVFRGVLDGVGAVIEWVRELITENEESFYKFTNGTDTIKVKATDLENLGAATYMTGMDVATLTGHIDGVVGAAVGVINSENITKMDGFVDLLRANNIDPNDPANTVKVARALVLYTAQKTQGKTADAIVQQVRTASNGTNAFAYEFQQAINSEDKTQAFVDAAMAYALVEAFANTENGSKVSVSVDGVTMKVPEYLASVNTKLGTSASGDAALKEVLAMLKTVSATGAFKNGYIKDNSGFGASATTDLTGYLSAMNAINDNIGNIDMDTYLDEGMSGDYMTGLVDLFDLSKN